MAEETTLQYPGVFLVNVISGELKLLQGLDREKRDKYEVTVEAYDQGNPSLSSQVNVRVEVRSQPALSLCLTSDSALFHF